MHTYYIEFITWNETAEGQDYHYGVVGFILEEDENQILVGNCMARPLKNKEELLSPFGKHFVRIDKKKVKARVEFELRDWYRD